MFITLLLFLGGIRLCVAAVATTRWDTELTLAVFLLVAGAAWGLLLAVRRARRRWRRSRNLHGRAP